MRVAVLAGRRRVRGRRWTMGSGAGGTAGWAVRRSTTARSGATAVAAVAGRTSASRPAGERARTRTAAGCPDAGSPARSRGISSRRGGTVGSGRGSARVGRVPAEGPDALRPLRRGRVVEEGRRRRSRGLADDQGGCRDDRRRLPAGRGQWSRWRARSGTAACRRRCRPPDRARAGRSAARARGAARVERRLPGRDGRRPAPAHDRGERRRRDAEGFGESGRGRSAPGSAMGSPRRQARARSRSWPASPSGAAASLRAGRRRHRAARDGAQHARRSGRRSPARPTIRRGRASIDSTSITPGAVT